MMGILLGTALLIPPPEPPPPPERLAAAAELRRLAPFSPEFRENAFDRAKWRAASEALRGPGLESRRSELIGEAKDRIGARLAGSRPEVEARVDRCLGVRLGRDFDLATLQEMAKVVPTKGGYVLWERAMREPAQGCYDESVGQLLIGFAPSISWLAARGLLHRLPRHDPSRGIPPSLAGELETLCGKRARGVLQVRQGSLGISSQWVDRDIKSGRGKGETFFCLVSAAKVSGYEPFIFEP